MFKLQGGPFKISSSYYALLGLLLGSLQLLVHPSSVSNLGQGAIWLNPTRETHMRVHTPLNGIKMFSGLCKKFISSIV